MFNRIIKLTDFPEETCFLWGPRQTGKTTLLKTVFPQSLKFDLLKSPVLEKHLRDVSVFAQEVLAGFVPGNPVIIDEIQKLPRLLDDVQSLIVDHNIPFVLCGSSARKLKRGHGNLLGGRAIRHELFPLVFPEIPDFDLLRAINNGLIPRHYLSDRPHRLFRSYVGDYLKEEILAEALTRNVQAFSRFLEVAAIMSGEILNFSKIASECGVSAVTVREYFQILTDTLLGFQLPAYCKRPKRREIHAPKFYYFDVCLPNYLLQRHDIAPKSETFGRAFEQLIFQELRAYQHYSGKEYFLSYWRLLESGHEVDFVLGDAEVGIEVKGVAEVRTHHLKGLKEFAEEYHPKKNIVVSLDSAARKAGNIMIYPWRVFLEKLWAGEVIE